MTHMPQISRRFFLTTAAAASGGLALGFHLPQGVAAAGAAPGPAEVTAWVVIQPDDAVIIRVARSEMGQGITTSLPMLVAEELQCDWSKVRFEFPSPEENLRRKRAWGEMSTGGSRSVRTSQEYLRKAGAAAREMLIAAAAAQWGVPAAECQAANSIITHKASGRTLRYGEVAEAASKLPPPSEPKLKDPKDWTLLGTPQKRLDTLEKVTGKPIYGIDVRVPNMLYAAIVQCPVFGGTPKSYDETKIRGLKGVRQVVQLPNAVAVVADSWWQAKTAVDALPVTWDEGQSGKVSSTSIAEFLRAGLAAADAAVIRKDGDVDATLASAAKRIEAEYGAPFLSHATMEPQNCTAHVTPDKVEVWVSTQSGEAALAAAAAAAEVPPEKVVVHKTMLGGGFGRRGAVQDYVHQAVLVAKAVGHPVKLLWTREEDIRHDFYRPVAMAKFTAGLDTTGMPVGWRVRVTGPSILANLFPQRLTNGVDQSFANGFTDEMAYNVPNYEVGYAMRTTHVPVGFWRSVNHSQNGFFRESFIDEMAQAAGQDPYQYRRKLLSKDPVRLAVLDAAAQKAGWGNPTASGVSRGIALVEAYGSLCAQVAEVSVGGKGEVRVHRVVASLNTGHVVNPEILRAQTESAIVYGLSAALYGAITIENGRVQQGNFDDYEMLRLADMPVVETVLAPSGGFWGGGGEIGVPPLAPAVCNAIFAATGKRIRSLPLKGQDLKRV
ncbi:MAG: xanthine dehydrogenase family protein molybdopterin-binding subunit [Alphaproteobacteria bacterium]|nr:xanthine dehydrogenase family protein molybdopterin-binding subunit [Alphaproteobacteria bacterium]MBV9378473.1 xanthine dehydrogenase family protein molybdopterin-binding subunit [Alphaproteobacteria bacterium]